MRTDGFSMIEVVVALAVLGVVVLGFAATTGTLSRAADDSGQRLVALELLESRLREVAMDPEYEQLQSRYQGIDSIIPGFPGWRRITMITRVVQPGQDGRRFDVQRIMVAVDGPGLLTPIQRTITIAAP
ncbi:MAG TPA: prepilin-type N-terminal cleavage/methylation domain-containing protein [Longimicrobiales bacterium]